MSTSSRNQLRVNEQALAGITRGPLPASQKVYVPGTLHPDVRVPMREVTQTPTQVGSGAKAHLRSNPPFSIYDSSGPYTDPRAEIDLRVGLRPVRSTWISGRADTLE